MNSPNGDPSGDGSDAPPPPPPKKQSKIMLRNKHLDAALDGAPDLNDGTPSFDVTYGSEGSKFEKFKKNPLVPIGAVTTAGILIAGLLSFRSGNTRLSQQLMRARVIAQGATLGVLSLSVARLQMANLNKASGVTSPTN